MLTVLRPNDTLRVISVEGHWGRDPNGVMPPVVADAVPVVPNGNYGFDPMLNFWVPVTVSGGTIVEKFSELIANTLASILSETAEVNANGEVANGSLGALVELINARLGGNQTPYLWESLLNSVNALGFRKILNVDAGAYTIPAAGATTINYTGVNLAVAAGGAGRTCGVAWNLTEHKLYHITLVTDPSGGTPGAITLETPVGVANTQWVIPYLSVPHAYATTTDSLRVTNIAPEWSHYVEPTVFISEAYTGAKADGIYQYGPIPCLDYGRTYFQIVWTNPANGSRTLIFNLYGKMDPAAWPVPGAIPAQYMIHSWKEYSTTGQQFNGAAAHTGIILCRLQDAAMFDSLMVEITVAGSPGDASTTNITGYYGLAGAGR